MNIQPQLILLDLDGTMVDSVPDLAYCIDKMMEYLGQPPCGEQQVRNWVGNGLERLIGRALTGQMHAEPSKPDFTRAYTVFLELYEANTALRSTLYPGVTDGLEILRQRGYPLGCVTNKALRFVEPLLNELKIREYFSLIVAGDSLPRKKPDPAPLLHAAAHFGVDPINALMVGDSMHDVAAARAAGFAVVCVSYGYNHGEDIRTASPDAVIDSIAALPQLLPPTPTPIN